MESVVSIDSQLYDTALIEVELSEYESNNIIPPKCLQYNLQAPDNDWSDGVGRADHTKHPESYYTFNNLPSHWELYRFIKENNFYRTRVMKLRNKTCYSWHYDFTPRLHLSIVTNERCFFIIDKDVIHIPSDGVPRIVDTTKYHTAINANLKDFTRIHIVGCMNN